MINGSQPNHILLADTDIESDIFNKEMSYKVRKHECPYQSFKRIKKYKERGFDLVKMEFSGTCGELIPIQKGNGRQHQILPVLTGKRTWEEMNNREKYPDENYEKDFISDGTIIKKEKQSNDDQNTTNN